jgi:hypothetical protein
MKNIVAMLFIALSNLRIAVVEYLDAKIERIEICELGVRILSHLSLSPHVNFCHANIAKMS